MQESIYMTNKDYQDYNELSRQVIGAAIEVCAEIIKKLCISVPLC